MCRLQCTFGKRYLSSLLAFCLVHRIKKLVEAVVVWGSSFGKMFLQFAVLLSTFKCPSCLISSEQKESFSALIENISNS